YDGNSTTSIKTSPPASLVGVILGDSVTLDGSTAGATFDTKNVGTGKTVTASGYGKTGTDANNYIFASPQGTTTADITAKNLTINGAVANDKIYDRTTSATVNFAGASLSGIVGTESVSINS